MSRSDTKTIAIIVPSRGATMPFTVNVATTLGELLHAAKCPDWYVASLTRKGPPIPLVSRRLLDVVHNKGKLYLAPPTTSRQLDLPLQGHGFGAGAPDMGDDTTTGTGRLPQ